MTKDLLGIYVHVPFCATKCPYCDFYSVPWRIPLEEQYLSALQRDFSLYHSQCLTADTVYFGGGTPSLIRPESIFFCMQSIRENFLLSSDAEITLECNPCTVTLARAAAWAEAGINRASLGMQSTSAEELRLLGRKHTPDMVEKAIQALRNAGIQNISLDIMMAVPHQTQESLDRAIDFAAESDVQHISAYLLQIEPGTPFASSPEIHFCPDEEQTADLYLHAVERLGQYGYAQYEISNFAKPGFESRHNTKYWKSIPYLGFGPAAHSCFEGKRFAYPANLNRYLQSSAVEYADEEPDAAEYAMLRLRLTDGLAFSDYAAHGGNVEQLQKRCRLFAKSNLIQLGNDRINLTPQGFLLSNTLIADLLF